VRFSALACDYDGTLALRDRIGPETLAALEHARRAGLRLILVTGRTFFELTRVFERLDLFVLERLPGVTWIEVRDRSSVEQAVAHFEQDPSACVVMDLSALPHPGKVQLIEATLDVIRGLRQRLGLPHWVILDEAHYSLHRSGVRETAIDIEHRGFCLVTYKASWLRPSVVHAIGTFVLTRTTAPKELSFLQETLAAAGEQVNRS
jgi:hypothetical protein